MQDKITILTGKLNLSRIPEELIRTDAKGERYVFVDVAEKFKPGEFGHTHNITLWSAGTGKVYIGDLKPKQLPLPGEKR